MLYCCSVWKPRYQAVPIPRSQLTVSSTGVAHRGLLQHSGPMVDRVQLPHCVPIDGMAYRSGRGIPGDLVVGACCRFLLEAEVSSVAAHLQTSALPLMVRGIATQSKPA